MTPVRVNIQIRTIKIETPPAWIVVDPPVSIPLIKSPVVPVPVVVVVESCVTIIFSSFKFSYRDSNSITSFCNSQDTFYFVATMLIAPAGDKQYTTY